MRGPATHTTWHEGLHSIRHERDLFLIKDIVYVLTTWDLQAHLPPAAIPLPPAANTIYTLLHLPTFLLCFNTFLHSLHALSLDLIDLLATWHGTAVAAYARTRICAGFISDCFIVPLFSVLAGSPLCCARADQPPLKFTGYLT